jgi:hypothetical protein
VWSWTRWQAGRLRRAGWRAGQPAPILFLRAAVWAPGKLWYSSVNSRTLSRPSDGPAVQKGDTNSDPCYNRKVWAVRPIATQYPQLRVAGMDPAIPLGTWLFPQARAD